MYSEIFLKGQKYTQINHSLYKGQDSVDYVEVTQQPSP